jgi:site-specific DNA recombinase
MRVLGVVRLSRSTDKSTSVTRQRARLREWCKARGAELIEMVEDVDVSGASSPWERPQLGPWLTKPDLIDSYDVLLSIKMDRFGRSQLHFVHLLEWTSEHGKALACTDQEIETLTPQGRAFASLLAVFAQMERDMITERIRDQKAYATEQGHFQGSVPPFGYMPVRREDGRPWLEFDPVTKPFLVEMIDRVMAGELLSTIVRDFNARSVPTAKQRLDVLKEREPRAGSWARSPAERMLQNVVLMGYSRDRDGNTIYDGEGQPVTKAPALLTPVEFARLQEAVSAVKWRKSKAVVPNVLLDVSACAKCGRKIYRTIVKNDFRYLVCSGRRRGLCDQRQLREDLILEDVDMVMSVVLADVPIVRREYVSGFDVTGEISAVKEEMGRLASLYAKGKLIEDVYDTLSAPLSAKLADLEAEPVRESGWRMVPTEETYGERWERSDSEDRRDLLISAGIAIHLGRDVHLADDTWAFRLSPVPDRPAAGMALRHIVTIDEEPDHPFFFQINYGSIRDSLNGG